MSHGGAALGSHMDEDWWNNEARSYIAYRQKQPPTGCNKSDPPIPLKDDITGLEAFWIYCEEVSLALMQWRTMGNFQINGRTTDSNTGRPGIPGFPHISGRQWYLEVLPTAANSISRRPVRDQIAAGRKLEQLARGHIGSGNGGRQLLWGPLRGMEVFEVAVRNDLVLVYAIRPQRTGRHTWLQEITILDFVAPTRALNPVKNLLRTLRYSCLEFPEFIQVEPYERDVTKRSPQSWDVAVSELCVVRIPVVPYIEGDLNGSLLSTYTVPSAHILELVDRASLAFKLSEQERQVVSLDSNVILIGRSGTGKTTCGILRLWSQFQAFTETAGRALIDPRPTKFIETAKAAVGDEDDDGVKEKEGEGAKGDTGPSTKTDTEDASNTDDDSDPSRDSDDGADLFDSFYWYENDADETETGIHPVFVTLSPVLCSEVQQYYNKLTRMYEAGQDGDGSGEVPSTHEPEEATTTDDADNPNLQPDSNIEEMSLLDDDSLEREMFSDLPPSFIEMQDKHFPCFLTLRRFLLMLDGTLKRPFFVRNAEGVLVHSYEDIQQWRADSRGTMRVMHRYHASGVDAGLDDGDWLDDYGDVYSAMRARDADLKRMRLVENEVDGIEVDYNYFVTNLWPRMRKRDQHAMLHPSVVYAEIISVIKGSREALESNEGYLSHEAYLNMARRRNLLGRRERLVVYHYFNEYRKIVNGYHCFDTQDVVRHIYNRLSIEGYRGAPIHYVCLDEVQDFTQATIALFFQVCYQKEAFFFTGDTCQTIARGIGFRFSDLRTLVNYYRQKSPADVHQLTINYRSHSALLQLGNSVVSLLEELFPDTIDKLAHDHGTRAGPKPVILDMSTHEELFRFLCGKSGSRPNNRLEFGAQQVVIVRDEAARARLPDILKPALCLTVFEAKGLEFDDVILYNFWEDSPCVTEWRVLNDPSFQPLISEIAARVRRRAARRRKRSGEAEDDPEGEGIRDPSSGLVNVSELGLEGLTTDGRSTSEHLRPVHFDALRHNLLNSELKHLYVALTRARKRVFIFDTDVSRRAPMFKFWLTSELVQILRPGDDPGHDEILNPTDRKQWLDQGKSMMRRGYWLAAEMCFEYAEQPRLTRQARGMRLATDASAALGAKFEAETSGTSNWTTIPAEIREKFQEAAGLFEENGSHVHAARCYLSAGDPHRAADLFERCGRWAEVGAARAVDGNYTGAIEAYSRAGDLRGVIANAAKLPKESRLVTTGGAVDPVMTAIQGIPLDQRGADWADIKDKQTVVVLRRLRLAMATRDVTQARSGFCKDIAHILNALGCDVTDDDAAGQITVTNEFVTLLDKLGFPDLACDLILGAEAIASDVDIVPLSTKLVLKTIQSQVVRRSNNVKIGYLAQCVKAVEDRVDLLLSFGLCNLAIDQYVEQGSADSFARAFRVVIQFGMLSRAIVILSSLASAGNVDEAKAATRLFLSALADTIWDQVKLRSTHQTAQDRKSPQRSDVTDNNATATGEASLSSATATAASRAVSNNSRVVYDAAMIDDFLDQVKQVQIQTQQHAHSTLALSNHIRGLIAADSDILHQAVYDLTDREMLYKARSLIAIGLFGGARADTATESPRDLALSLLSYIDSLVKESTTAPSAVLGAAAIAAVGGYFPESHLLLHPGHTLRELTAHYTVKPGKKADTAYHYGPRGRFKYPDAWNSCARLHTFSNGSSLVALDAAVCASRRSLMAASMRAVHSYLRDVKVRDSALILERASRNAYSVFKIASGEWRLGDLQRANAIRLRACGATEAMALELATFELAPKPLRGLAIASAYESIRHGETLFHEDLPDECHEGADIDGHYHIYRAFALFQAANRVDLFTERVYQSAVPKFVWSHGLLGRMHEADIAGDWLSAAELALKYLELLGDNLEYSDALALVERRTAQLLVLALGSSRLDPKDDVASPYMRTRNAALCLPVSIWDIATRLTSDEGLRDVRVMSAKACRRVISHEVDPDRLSALLHEHASYLLYLFNSHVPSIQPATIRLLAVIARNGFLNFDACIATRDSVVDAGGIDEDPARKTLYELVDADGDSLLTLAKPEEFDANFAQMFAPYPIAYAPQPGRSAHRSAPDVADESRKVRRPHLEECDAFLDDSASQTSEFSVIHNPETASTASSTISSSWTDGGLSAASTSESGIGGSASLMDTSIESASTGMDVMRDLTVDESAALIIQCAWRHSRVRAQLHAAYLAREAERDAQYIAGCTIARAWRTTRARRRDESEHDARMYAINESHPIPTFTPTIGHIARAEDDVKACANDADAVSHAISRLADLASVYKTQLVYTMKSLLAADSKLTFSTWIYDQCHYLTTAVDTSASAVHARYAQPANGKGKGPASATSTEPLSRILERACADYHSRYDEYVLHLNQPKDNGIKGNATLLSAQERQRQKARRRLHQEFVRAQKAMVKAQKRA